MAIRLSSRRSEKATLEELLKLKSTNQVSSSKKSDASASHVCVFLKNPGLGKGERGSHDDRDFPRCFHPCQILFFCRRDDRYGVLVCNSANSSIKVAGSTGLTTWISKPASLVFCRSSSCPHPVTAMIFIRRPHSWLRIIRHAS